MADYDDDRPDGAGPESCEPYRAQLLRVYMSGATNALRPVDPETNPEYIRASSIETLDHDAGVLASFVARQMDAPAYTVLDGIGCWRGTREVARVIEVIHTGMSVKQDLLLIRHEALRLGYTVLVTVQDVIASEVY